MESWKRYEHYIAKRLGSRRIPILGREGADVAVEGLWIDCKKRVSVPWGWEKQLKCAETLGYKAILVWHQEGLIATRLDYFLSLPQYYESVMSHTTLSPTPIKWLEHIKLSCPDDHMPMIAMIKSDELYKNSILVFALSHYARWWNDTRQFITAGAEPSAAAE